jgi:hypothetical protein
VNSCKRKRTEKKGRSAFQRFLEGGQQRTSCRLNVQTTPPPQCLLSKRSRELSHRRRKLFVRRRFQRFLPCPFYGEVRRYRLVEVEETGGPRLRRKALEVSVRSSGGGKKKGGRISSRSERKERAESNAQLVVPIPTSSPYWLEVSNLLT